MIASRGPTEEPLREGGDLDVLVDWETRPATAWNAHRSLLEAANLRHTLKRSPGHPAPL